jgi:peptide/nickel transport system permease protein
MLAYIAMRLGHALAVLLGVIFVVSVLVKLIPGDPVDIMSAGNPGITPAQKQELREQLGLTRPLLEQFTSYVGRALQAMSAGRCTAISGSRSGFALRP